MESKVDAGFRDIQDVTRDIISPDGGMSSEEVLELLGVARDWISELHEEIRAEAEHAGP